MLKYVLGWLSSLVIAVFIPSGLCAQTLVAAKVSTAPVIDGDASDRQWQDIPRITTMDKIAAIEITLAAVHTESQVFVLVGFADPDLSAVHKAWRWNAEKRAYDIGPEREDVLVLKWNMMPRKLDLSIFADNAYDADVWFWKACRTNPVGYADDKHQSLTVSNVAKSKAVTSRTGRIFYLHRDGDQGTAAYLTKIYAQYQGDILPRFENAVPTGSRADIRAKGSWKEGHWTIEFGRALDTGHPDDIQLKPGGKYQFGVSRYEIAGRDPEPHASQPLYGTGDTSEDLTLYLVP